MIYLLLVERNLMMRRPSSSSSSLLYTWADRYEKAYKVMFLCMLIAAQIEISIWDELCVDVSWGKNQCLAIKWKWKSHEKLDAAYFLYLYHDPHSNVHKNIYPYHSVTEILVSYWNCFIRTCAKLQVSKCILIFYFTSEHCCCSICIEFLVFPFVVFASFMSI